VNGFVMLSGDITLWARDCVELFFIGFEWVSKQKVWNDVSKVVVDVKFIQGLYFGQGHSMN